MSQATSPEAAPERLERLWRKHGRTFWVLHSVWALATGAVVIYLAHERYHFVHWVVGFLLVTWASTLYFGRPRSDVEVPVSRRFGHGLASYTTRVMYQETLFFLIPFYAYSTVVPSWNLAFVGLLAALAILACLDLVFDRWLRESPVFGLVFFATVTFAALNLLIPMLFSVDPARATPFAALAAVATALPLTVGGGLPSTGAKLRTALAALAILGVAIGFPRLVPPVPLRLQEITFAGGFDRSTLEPVNAIGKVASSETLGALVVVARVFAPVNVPARIALEWYRDDGLVRSSREVEIVAHEGGFRFWDALRASSDVLEPGRYRVVLRTAGGRAFGSAAVSVR